MPRVDPVTMATRPVIANNSLLDTLGSATHTALP
jgi:hypothetical protein